MIPNYEHLESGVIHQLNSIKYTYDYEYVHTRYDSYGIKCDLMSYLRYGTLVTAIGHHPESILDVGYGNGSFIKACHSAGVDSYGTDVSNYPLEVGTILPFTSCFNKHFEVITFFDSLEHFDDTQFLKNLDCDYIMISVPNCHYNSVLNACGTTVADSYFTEWKHRKPNEHMWHFDANALNSVMNSYGYSTITTNHVEDAIRLPTESAPNILTGVFKKI